MTKALILLRALATALPGVALWQVATTAHVPHPYGLGLLCTWGLVGRDWFK